MLLTWIAKSEPNPEQCTQHFLELFHTTIRFSLMVVNLVKHLLQQLLQMASFKILYCAGSLTITQFYTAELHAVYLALNLRQTWVVLFFVLFEYVLYFYFFLPLVPIGVAGGHSCLSAARWVAWRRDIP